MNRTLIIGAVAVIILIGIYLGTSRDAMGSYITLSVQNLAPLEQGIYEGWAIQGENKVSFGRFNVNEEGNLVDEQGEEISRFETVQRISDVDAFAITIEPSNDSDPGPSKSIILVGDVSEESALLTFAAVDVSGLSGQYILGTPTNDPAANETAGIWFVNPTNAPTLTPSLIIPDAPEGWKYEGWGVYQGAQPITTGRFSSASGADEFNDYSGQQAGPPFPGEDFIQGLPFDLAGPLAMDDGASLVVVSIEPDLDGIDPTGDGPFQLKPLVGVIPAGAQDHFLYDLELKDDAMPSGIVSMIQ